MNRNRSNGQAMLEYLLLFAIVLFLALKFIQSVGVMLDKTYGPLRKVLSDELSVGLCPENSSGKNCVRKYDAYQN